MSKDLKELGSGQAEKERRAFQAVGTASEKLCDRSKPGTSEEQQGGPGDWRGVSKVERGGK